MLCYLKEQFNRHQVIKIKIYDENSLCLKFLGKGYFCYVPMIIYQNSNLYSFIPFEVYINRIIW